MVIVHTHLLCVCKIYKSEIFVVSGLDIRKVVSAWLGNKKVFVKLVE